MTPPLALRTLVDESCDCAVVRALRADGHNVLALSGVTRRPVDRAPIGQAHRERRIPPTEEQGFGWLGYVSHAHSAGVTLVRPPGTARCGLTETTTRPVREAGARPTHAFVVVQPGQLQIGRAADVGEEESPHNDKRVARKAR